MEEHILVSGRVQGVGYRAWLQAVAEAHGLTGWARNLQDGRVEAVLGGPEESIREVIALARTGPPAAHVNTVEQRTATAKETELSPTAKFSVLPTA